MSLISDALKEAQRERSERTAPRPPALLGDSFFPYPSAKKRGAPNRAMLLGGAGVLVLAILGFGVGRVISQKNAARRNAVVATRPTVPVTQPVAVAPKPAPAVAEKPVIVPPSHATTGATSEAQHSRAESRPAPARSVAGPRPDGGAVVASATKSKSAASKPVPSQDSTLPVANLPTTGTASTASSPVRVVVDPVGLRPGDSLFARAYAEHMRGNLDGAADLYEKAIQKPPVSPELYNDYGALLASRGNHTAALAMYRLGLAAKNDDAKLWINVADSYKALGRRAEALSAYFQAAKLDPSNATAKMRLAGEYQAIGDTASARRGYEDAARTAPRDPDVHYNYGAFLQSQRDYAGAIRELQAFVDLAPGRFSQDFIERTKAYISNLRRQFP